MHPADSPRRIVLLSDGTGNSSAKLMKTNVWRMYEAMDLSAGDQLALYDNGVGTSSFRLFALLGGGLGWGLKRNVLDLYAFACRNYQPASGSRPADEIYAFGFSRGAFTARVLVGLIESQGLVAGARGADLDRLARWAYREYRRQFNVTGGLVSPLRALRDRVLRTWDRVRGRRTYEPAANLRPRVRFVGLWDTVDAYGLPIDEMTRGWDQWVWPLSMQGEVRPALVDKLCHAVALDDERHTFHPVLLDETAEPACRHTDDERVTQVWFAGVHSNVGGGYPDDSLAYVSLRWMGREAAKQGLRLHPHAVASWDAHANPHGPIYDSRSGLGAYYRYNPRRIDRLTADPYAAVSIARPKIHESVFERIRAGRDDYAPIVLPAAYAVVTADGAIVDGADNPYEHPTQAEARASEQERVWNRVWWRRIAYFLTVFLTVVLVARPFVSWSTALGPLDRDSRALSGVIELLGQFLPGMAQPWVAYYERYPFELAVPGLLVAALLGAGTGLQRAIGDRMHRVWTDTLAGGPRPVPPRPLPTDVVYRLRSHPLYRAAFDAATEHVFPFVFGLGSLLAVGLLVVATANRAAFAVASASGRICQEIAVRPPAADGTWTTDLLASDLCRPTGIALEAGVPYRLEIALPASGWFDGDMPVATSEGFGVGRRPWVLLPGLAFRRVLTTAWFVPMARIGSKGAEYHPLSAAVTEFTPRRTGQLFLFVNDAIGPWPLWQAFYGNNAINEAGETGRPARVTVTRLRTAAASR